MAIRSSLFFLATLFSFAAFAQDSLFYRNGNVIVGQVLDIGLDAITYRITSSGEQVRVVVDRRELSRIHLNGGQTFVISSAQGPPSSANGRTSDIADRAPLKHAVSLDVIAPAFGHLTLGYEHVVAPHISAVASVGYIGLWNLDEYDKMFNSRGGTVTAGMKFILPRSAKQVHARGDAQPLVGWYLKPEILYGAWTAIEYIDEFVDPYYQYTTVKVKADYQSTALALSIGRQLYVGQHITFDIFGGIGYATQLRSGVQAGFQRMEYAFTHLYFGTTTPFMIRGGLRFGYAF